MPETNINFIPKRVKKENLNNIVLENGAFIITTDTGEIFADVQLPNDEKITRVPLGGDLAQQIITWDFIKDKPFTEVSSNDFEIIEEAEEDGDTGEFTVTATLQVNSNLKFSDQNRLALTRFTRDTDGWVLYDQKRVGEPTSFFIKGRVDNIDALNNIQNPSPGNIYLVGASTATTFDKYVYISTNAEQGEGQWEPLYLIAPDYSSGKNLPTINSVEIKGNLTLSDLGIVEAPVTYMGDTVFNDLPVLFSPKDVNKVYNVTDSFTTGNNFKVSGISLPSNTKVIIVYNNGIFLYDIFSESYTYRPTIVTMTLRASDWTNTVPYSQTINNNNIFSTSYPVADIILSDNVTLGLQQQTEFEYITKAETTDGSVTFKCYENKPTIDLSVSLKI